MRLSRHKLYLFLPILAVLVVGSIWLATDQHAEPVRDVQAVAPVVPFAKAYTTARAKPRAGARTTDARFAGAVGTPSRPAQRATTTLGDSRTHATREASQRRKRS